MRRDLSTVIWKERKLLFNQRGGRKQVILTLLVPAAMFAILLPWQEGDGFFESPLAVISSILIPMLIWSWQESWPKISGNLIEGKMSGDKR